MELLKYKVEDSTIAELLGVQNFTNKESAILELVKNAFDAEATEVKIIFEKNKIIVHDNGIGMNYEDIKKNWMYIGKSEKKLEYMIIDGEENERVLSGSKGIGRFAISRLGEKVKIYSTKRNDNSILWTTDWETSTLKETDGKKIEIGTKIEIEKVRDKWNEVNVQKLVKYLSKTFKETFMKINIHHDNNIYQVEEYFLDPKLGYHFLSKINIEYLSKNQKLICKIISDEFKDEVKDYYDKDFKNHITVIDIYDEFKNFEELGKTEKEKREFLKKIGDFSAEFYFLQNAVSKDDYNKFLYKHFRLKDRYESGIILYRNSFSISSFNGIKDWLELGKRYRKSPAAATHPTGNWRVKENNLAGKIIIDKEKNKELKDLSNRQGLDENEYYEIFVEIILKGISIFEEYRQGIIKAINKKNEKSEDVETKIIDLVKKDPNYIAKLTDTEIKEFIKELNDIEKKEKEVAKETIKKEEQYKYDIRILNTLATSGLKATSIAHELKNDRNFVKTSYANIVGAMQEYDIWNYVNEDNKKEKSYKNIPYLLSRTKEINEKILIFLNNILEEAEKRQFYLQEVNILESLEKIRRNWLKDYSWINIKFEIEENLIFKISEDILKVIFDNLILNSVQQNDNKNKLEIKILINRNDENKLNVYYRDNGKGLDKKYLNNPNRILLVHETSREDGHGLGMWIVNSTILMTKGEIKKIIGDTGFEINFILGELKGWKR